MYSLCKRSVDVTSQSLLTLLTTPPRVDTLRPCDWVPTQSHSSQLSLKILSKVRAPGFEPGTYRVSVDCSSQLSYARTFDRINSITITENPNFNKRKKAVVLTRPCATPGIFHRCHGEVFLVSSLGSSFGSMKIMM